MCLENYGSEQSRLPRSGLIAGESKLYIASPKSLFKSLKYESDRDELLPAYTRKPVQERGNYKSLGHNLLSWMNNY